MKREEYRYWEKDKRVEHSGHKLEHKIYYTEQPSNWMDNNLFTSK